MSILEMFAVSTADNSGMRLLLLASLILAICLILAGGMIALLTLRSQRKTSYTAFEKAESKLAQFQAAGTAQALPLDNPEKD